MPVFTGHLTYGALVIMQVNLQYLYNYKNICIISELIVLLALET